MALKDREIDEKIVGKKLYDYQKKAIDEIFSRLNQQKQAYNLLYQLPTGGGKTVIFSEITKRYIAESKKKVLVLTHRIELCKQTSNMLGEFGVNSKVIDSRVKELPDQENYMCFVAMVETLNNRLQDEKLVMDNIGLVIIDEAHYNSFRKLFSYFESCIVLGVTATPLSSNIKLPMKKHYNELIVGDSIKSLIDNGFLSKATTYSYNVGLTNLTVGVNGDYTVSSSERLYTHFSMLERLLMVYEDKSKGKKTLIFNNGINTSLEVYTTFKQAGYDIRHLDNKNTANERKEIITWFKNTPNAILTSVSILTTGFDEPTVESIILNRATKSLTLYHQMIGRGSRILPNKSTFTIIDLGNNAARFGLWDQRVDWHEIFRSPDFYIENISSDAEIERKFKYVMPEEVKAKFANSAQVHFDIEKEYDQLIKKGLKSKQVLENSLAQHVQICLENSKNAAEAKALAKLLEEDIKYRVKNYSYCISKATSNYVKWLQEEYIRKLNFKLNRAYF